VRGLEMGADDYVVKPFNHKELLARMKVVLTRKRNEKEFIPVGELDAEAEPDNVKIDVNTGTVMRNDKYVKLTSTEYSLLKYLAGQAGRTVSDNDILAHVWGEEYTDSSEYLEAYVKRLRGKLEANPSNPRFLLKDGEGYRIAQGAI
jgi:DNA-binding response OmpR family regulator